MTAMEFQKLYPTKEEREEAIKRLPDEEIDEIINSCGTVQAKIYYSQLKKRNQEMREREQSQN
jgi:hypothetical protein